MFRKFRQFGVIPVVTAEKADTTLRLCEALLKGNLPVLEITFRTREAENSIRAVAERFPEIMLGAGTILTVDQLRRAFDAGAGFAVAPGCSDAILEAASKDALPFAPGVCTPSDVERALAMEYTNLKFFPAEATGGVRMLKALSGPYGHLELSFCPTGGINAENMLDYLALPQVACVGGSWIAGRGLATQEKWDEITERARQAVERAGRMA